MDSLSLNKFYVMIACSEVIYNRLTVSQNGTVITSTDNLPLLSLT